MRFICQHNVAQPRTPSLTRAFIHHICAAYTHAYTKTSKYRYTCDYTALYECARIRSTACA